MRHVDSFQYGFAAMPHPMSSGATPRPARKLGQMNGEVRRPVGSAFGDGRAKYWRVTVGRPHRLCLAVSA
jgi:hypothetical protein